MDNFEQLKECMKTLSLIDQICWEGLVNYGALTEREALSKILRLVTELNKKYKD